MSVPHSALQQLNSRCERAAESGSERGLAAPLNLTRPHRSERRQSGREKWNRQHTTASLLKKREKITQVCLQIV